MKVIHFFCFSLLFLSGFNLYSQTDTIKRKFPMYKHAVSPIVRIGLREGADNYIGLSYGYLIEKARLSKANRTDARGLYLTASYLHSTNVKNRGLTDRNYFTVVAADDQMVNYRITQSYVRTNGFRLGTSVMRCIGRQGVIVDLGWHLLAGNNEYGTSYKHFSDTIGFTYTASELAKVILDEPYSGVRTSNYLEIGGGLSFGMSWMMLWGSGSGFSIGMRISALDLSWRHLLKDTILTDSDAIYQPLSTDWIRGNNFKANIQLNFYFSSKKLKDWNKV